VRSQPGEGATFTVLLPIESDAYAAYAAYAEPKSESTRITTSRPDGKKPPLPPRRGLPSHLDAVIETRHTDFVTSNAAACSRG